MTTSDEEPDSIPAAVAVPSGPPKNVPALTERGRRTRAALVRGARKVFERDGFLEARIADIAKTARVAHGTFYTYFPSKEAIFREVIKATQQEMIDVGTRAGPPHEGPVAGIERSNRAFIEAYRRNAAIMATLEEVATLNVEMSDLRIQVRERFVERNARAISGWQRSGAADADLDPRIAASALGNMVDRFAYVWMVLGEPFDEEDAIINLTRLWANALGLREPRRASSTGGRDQPAQATQRARP